MFSDVMLAARIAFIGFLRQRIYIVVFLFAVLISLISYLLGNLSFRDNAIIAVDIGLGLINISAIILSVLLGAFIFPRDLDQGYTAFLIYNKKSRIVFLFGKFVGFLLAILLIVVIMTFITACSAGYFGAWPKMIFYQSISTIIVESIFFLSSSMLFSLITTPVTACFSQLGLYIILHSRISSNIMLSLLFPNFESLNLKGMVSSGVNIDLSHYLLILFYPVPLVLFILAVDIYIFCRKDLK